MIDNKSTFNVIWITNMSVDKHYIAQVHFPAMVIGFFKSSYTSSTHIPTPDFGRVCTRVAHLFSLLCCFVFYLSSTCVLCAQCCHCLWIVHFWLPHRFSRRWSPTTSTCCRISTMTVSSRNLLTAIMQVPHSYIIWLSGHFNTNNNTSFSTKCVS
jgi:hypothetical protein